MPLYLHVPAAAIITETLETCLRTHVSLAILCANIMTAARGNPTPIENKSRLPASRRSASKPDRENLVGAVLP
jgi:hypothetical protein